LLHWRDGDSSMKICIFVENYYRGGVETVVKQLVGSWQKEGFEISLITNESNPILQDTSLSNSFSEVHLFDFITCSNWFAGTSKWTKYKRVNSLLDVLRKLIKSVSLFMQVHYFKNYFLSVKSDLLFNVNGGYPGSISSRAAAIGWAKAFPIGVQIMAIHQLVEKSRFPFRLIDNYIDSKVFTNVDKIITVSEICKSSFKNRRSIAKCNSQIVIKNGVDLEITKPSFTEIKRESFNVSENTTVFLMAASYELRKGHRFLLQSFARMSKQSQNCHLICVGDDPTRMIPQLLHISSNLGINKMVTFLDYRDDVADLLEMSDVVVIPSQKPESSSLIAIEALAHFKPIVATNVGALIETIPHGLGALLFDRDDIEGFSQALVELSTNLDLYSSLAYESEKLAMNYSLERMLSSYKNEILDLLL